MQSAIATSNDGKPVALYRKLEERIFARDSVGASEVYYELLRAGRPLTEMIAEGVRIHAPITHVPYHERIDNGFVNFVPNDHCLLSARVALHMSKLVPLVWRRCLMRRQFGICRPLSTSGTSAF